MSLNYIAPEPSWQIVITPVMTGGVGTTKGNYLLLNNNTTDNGTIQVGSIIFIIDGINHIQTMTLKDIYGNEINGYTQLVVIFDEPLKIGQSIYNPIYQSSITFRLNSTTFNSDPQISDPILDIFREFDLITISLFNGDSNISQQVFTGEISHVGINSSETGTFVNLILGGLGNILARSMVVNNSAEQSIQGTLASNYSQSLKLGDLITQLIDETYISALGTGIKYNIGTSNNYTEKIASGKVNITTDSNNNIITVKNNTTGSALTSNSYVFISTPPTAHKLEVILELLYAFNRIFYIDLDGFFVITPLQKYFDDNQSWYLDYNGLATKDGALDCSVYVPVLGISSAKNTAVLANRILCTLSQTLTQFSLVDGADKNLTTVPQSVVTPPQDIFPRAWEAVQSQLGMQTYINLQSVSSGNIVQNSGLLNTVLGIAKSNVQGLYTKMVIDGNQSFLQGSKNFDDIKYLTASYGARSLAESLKDDLLVDVIIPLKYTYLPSTQTFRNIPINQMVTMPNVKNNIFDGQSQLFCFGFDIILQNHISLLILHLCKPFVYTALWANSVYTVDLTTFSES